jgi:hypothetical protein
MTAVRLGVVAVPEALTVASSWTVRRTCPDWPSWARIGL